MTEREIDASGDSIHDGGRKRCQAIMIRTIMDNHGSRQVNDGICGRWLGHEGPHRQMGSDETWEGEK